MVRFTRQKASLLQRGLLTALLLFPSSLFAAILVVAGANSPLPTLNKSEISAVFLGKVCVLPDGQHAVPIDQPESSPLRNEFYSEVANKSAAQAKAYWAKLYFTGRGVPPREGRNSGDVKRIVNSVPGAIGYIDSSALDRSVKVIFVVQ